MQNPKKHAHDHLICQWNKISTQRIIETDAYVSSVYKTKTGVGLTSVKKPEAPSINITINHGMGKRLVKCGMK